MTPRHLIALANPCARAYETIREEFFDFVRFKDRTWSTILTINK